MATKRKQLSIRSVSNITFKRLREVHLSSRLPMGALVDDAIEYWWKHLPEEGDQDIEPSQRGER